MSTNFKKRRRNQGRVQTWHAPQQMILNAYEKQDTETVRLIEQLPALFKTTGTLYFDFSKTTQIFPDAAIYLLAQVCALQDKYPNIALKLSPKITPKTKEVLSQIGLLTLLGSAKQVPSTREDVIHWRCATGSQVEGHKYVDVLGHYQGVIAQPLSKELYAGLVEAMGNTSHAYDQQLLDACIHPFRTPKWWMFSQEKNNNLSVVFCDIGAGIPASLCSAAHLDEQINDKELRSAGHAGLIRLAVESNASRVDAPNRGKGLGQIVKFISQTKDSSIRILSSKGFYQHKNINGTLETQTRNSKSVIIGTIVSWRIPLPSSNRGATS